MKMLQDDKGNVSSMRLTMFICILVAAYLSGVAMTREGGPTAADIYLAGAWLLAGIGGKNIGKFLEGMNDRKGG